MLKLGTEWEPLPEDFEPEDVLLRRVGPESTPRRRPTVPPRRPVSSLGPGWEPLPEDFEPPKIGLGESLQRTRELAGEARAEGVVDTALAVRKSMVPFQNKIDRLALAEAERFGNEDTGREEIGKLSDAGLAARLLAAGVSVDEITGNRLLGGRLSIEDVRARAAGAGQLGNVAREAVNTGATLFGFKKVFARNAEARRRAEDALYERANTRLRTAQSYAAERAERGLTATAQVAEAVEAQVPYLIEFAVPMGGAAKAGKALSWMARAVKAGRAARQSLPVVVPEAVARYAELRADDVAMDERGRLRVTDNGAGTLESASKAIGGSALSYAIERGAISGLGRGVNRLTGGLPGRAVSATGRALADTAHRLTPSALRRAVVGLRAGKRYVAQRFPSLAKGWQVFNDATGFHTLGEEIFVEEVGDKLADAWLNLSNRFERAGLQNTPEAVGEFLRELPVMAASFALVRGGQYALSRPMAWAEKRALEASIYNDLAPAVPASARDFVRSAPALALDMVLTRTGLFPLSTEALLAGNMNRHKDIRRALSGFGVSDNEITLMSPEERIDRLHELFTGAVDEKTARAYLDRGVEKAYRLGSDTAVTNVARDLITGRTLRQPEHGTTPPLPAEPPAPVEAPTTAAQTAPAEAPEAEAAGPQLQNAKDDPATEAGTTTEPQLPDPNGMDVDELRAELKHRGVTLDPRRKNRSSYLVEQVRRARGMEGTNGTEGTETAQSEAAPAVPKTKEEAQTPAGTPPAGGTEETNTAEGTETAQSEAAAPAGTAIRSQRPLTKQQSVWALRYKQRLQRLQPALEGPKRDSALEAVQAARAQLEALGVAGETIAALERDAVPAKPASAKPARTKKPTPRKGRPPKPGTTSDGSAGTAPKSAAPGVATTNKNLTRRYRKALERVHLVRGTPEETDARAELDRLRAALQKRGLNEEGLASLENAATDNGTQADTKPANTTTPARSAAAIEETPATQRFEAVTPRDQVRVRGRWRVVDVDDLVTSDLPSFDQALQPRDRTTVEARAQVAEIAKGPDPIRLVDSPTTDTGAPLIDEHGYVISGNGRAMGVRQAYKSGRAKAYKDGIRRRALELGLSTEGVKRPVLVREILDTAGVPMTTVAELSNRPQGLQRSEAELADADAKVLVEGDLIDLFEPDQSGNVLAASNDEFLRAFTRAAGIEGMRKSDGRWSPSLTGRVKRAVLAAIFAKSEATRKEMSDALENAEGLGIKRVLDAIMLAGGRLLKLGSTKPEYDLTSDLGAALRDYIRYRKDFLASGIAFEEWLGQQELFEAQRLDEVEMLLRAMHGVRGAHTFRALLNRYAELAENIDTATASLFGDDVVPQTTKRELLEQARAQETADGENVPRTTQGRRGQPPAEKGAAPGQGRSGPNRTRKPRSAEQTQREVDRSEGQPRKEEAFSATRGVVDREAPELGTRPASRAQLARRVATIVERLIPHARVRIVDGDVEVTARNGKKVLFRLTPEIPLTPKRIAQIRATYPEAVADAPGLHIPAMYVPIRLVDAMGRETEAADLIVLTEALATDSPAALTADMREELFHWAVSLDVFTPEEYAGLVKRFADGLPPNQQEEAIAKGLKPDSGIWQRIRRFFQKLLATLTKDRTLRAGFAAEERFRRGDVFDRTPGHEIRGVPKWVPGPVAASVREDAQEADAGWERYAVGDRFRDVAHAMPVDDVEPELIDVSRSRSETYREAGLLVRNWPKTVTAADGSVVLLQHPEMGSMADRVKHMILNNRTKLFDAAKAKWLPNVVPTLENAALRIADARTDNRVYVRAYRGNRKHMVVVRPDGIVQDHRGFTGKLVTQFPLTREAHGDTFRVEWERNGNGRTPENPAPAPPASTVPGPRQEEFRKNYIAKPASPATGKAREQETTEATQGTDIETQDTAGTTDFADGTDFRGERYSVRVAPNGKPSRLNARSSRTEAFEPAQKRIDAAFTAVAELFADKTKAKRLAETLWRFLRKRDRNARADLSRLQVLFGTMMWYSERVPALRRMWDAAMNRDDHKHALMDAVLGDTAGGPNDAAAVLRALRKQHPATYAVLNRYLFERDRDAVGYRVEQVGKDVYKVVGLPDDTGKRRELARFNDEDTAWIWAYRLEADTYQQTLSNGEPADAARALFAARMITHRTYGLLRQNLTDLERLYRALGRPMPTIPAEETGGTPKTLWDALREMGDRRGYYMPRVRKPGRYVLHATKPGANPVRLHFDTTVGRAVAAAGYEEAGYAVAYTLSDRPSEEAFLEGNIAALDDLVEAAMKDVEKAAVDEASFDALGMTVTRAMYLRKDGKTEPHLIIQAPDTPEYTKILMEFGGQRYDDRQTGTGLAWHWVKPSKKLDQRILRALAHTKVAGHTVDLLHQALLGSLADVIHSRGSRAHKIGRSNATGADVWVGYEEDAERALIRMASSIAGGTAKSVMAKDMLNAMMGTDVSWEQYKRENLPEDIDQLSHADQRDELEQLWASYEAMVDERRIHSSVQPTAFKEALSFMREMLRNEEGAERIFNLVKGATAMWFLARPSSAAINLTALATVAPAAMHTFGGVPMQRAPVLLTRAARYYTQHHIHRKTGKGPAAPKEAAELFDEIRRRRWDASQYREDTVAVLQHWMGRGWTRALDMALTAFSQAEALNRAATIAATYWGIQERHPGPWTKADHEAALQTAHDVTEKAHGNYTKANLPSWARGDDTSRLLLRSAYMFRNYTHNYLQLLPATFRRDKTAFAYLMIAPMALGGVTTGAGGLAAVAVVKALAAVLRALGAPVPDDVFESFFGWLGKTFGWPVERFLRGGVAGVAGVDIRGSTEIHMGAPKTFWELFGAPGSVGRSLFEASQEALKGDPVRAVERGAPSAVASPIRAVRERVRGVTYGKGNKPLYDAGGNLVRPGAYATFLRMLGFNPMGVSEEMERHWTREQVKQYYEDMRSAVYDQAKVYAIRNGVVYEDTRYLTRIAQYDPDRFAGILEAAEQFNERVRRNNPPGVSYIELDSIRQSIRMQLQPPKTKRPADKEPPSLAVRGIAPAR